MVENKKKLKWGKPKLIILTRGKPEERCLSNCKGTDVLMGAAAGGCWWVGCTQCSVAIFAS